MIRGAVAKVSLDSITHNLRRVRSVVGPNTRILAMIKANAYGHGLLQVASTLSDAQALGVASVESAITLRESGEKKPIVLMQGYSDHVELAACDTHQLTPVVHHVSQLPGLQSNSFQRPLSYWLKLETGMNRLGLSCDDFQAAHQRLKAVPGLQPNPVVMTHLGWADTPSSGETAKQVACFLSALRSIDCLKSVCNSAAILNYPQAHYDWVRPGIMLYGVSPFEGHVGADFDLLPAMTLKARLIAVRQQKAGDRVGYGGVYRCPRDMLSGVVNIGYGDGYPRSAACGTPVLINGVQCPIIGRVSMDMLTVDLSALQYSPAIGTEVVLWGEGLPVEVVARCAGTIGYELLSQLTSRVHFKY